MADGGSPDTTKHPDETRRHFTKRMTDASTDATATRLQRERDVLLRVGGDGFRPQIAPKLLAPLAGQPFRREITTELMVDSAGRAAPSLSTAVKVGVQLPVEAVARSLFGALIALHAKADGKPAFYHRDLKWDNVLWASSGGIDRAILVDWEYGTDHDAGASRPAGERLPARPHSLEAWCDARRSRSDDPPPLPEPESPDRAAASDIAGCCIAVMFVDLGAAELARLTPESIDQAALSMEWRQVLHAVLFSRTAWPTDIAGLLRSHRVQAETYRWNGTPADGRTPAHAENERAPPRTAASGPAHAGDGDALRGLAAPVRSLVVTAVVAIVALVALACMWLARPTAAPAVIDDAPQVSIDGAGSVAPPPEPPRAQVTKDGPDDPPAGRPDPGRSSSASEQAPVDNAASTPALRSTPTIPGATAVLTSAPAGGTGVPATGRGHPYSTAPSPGVGSAAVVPVRREAAPTQFSGDEADALAAAAGSRCVAGPCDPWDVNSNQLDWSGAVCDALRSGRCAGDGCELALQLVAAGQTGCH